MVGMALAQGVGAVPALRKPLLWTQPNGERLEVMPCGDEFMHYYLTAGGDTLVAMPNGWLAAPQPMEMELRRTVAKEMREQQEQRRAAQREKHGHPALTAVGGGFPTHGEQHALVVLVEFADNSFNTVEPLETYSRMLNEEGFSDYHATGSARDYFLASSAGEYQPQFDVYGPVKLTNKMAYYGAESYIGHDSHPEEMVIEACLALDDSVDFSLYDVDEDGVIDNVYVFYAGRGQASGGSPNTIWPHAADVFSGFGKSYRFDGVLLDHYAMSNEQDESLSLSGIGTFVHEFSHVLGLPDLYATTYNSSFTPGSWSVMDYGPYNNGQHTPPLYSSYERYALGWIEPVDLGEEALTVGLPALSENVAYRIVSPQNQNEYFLFENRQQGDWDLYLPGHGMLAWHIDYKPQTWGANSVNNNPGHQCVDLLEADDVKTAQTRAGDAFPGTASITSLTAETLPGLVTWSGLKLDQPLTDIREVDGMIYFEYKGGNPPLAMNPLRLNATTPRSITVSWDAVEGADGYLLTAYEGEGADPAKKLHGYQQLDLGQSLEATVEGLEFETEYTLCVQSYDRLYKSLPQPLTARTEVATFDYLKPEIAALTCDETNGEVVAQWEPMEGAVSYEVRFFERQYTDAERETVDFTLGLEHLPEGWSTNSTRTYTSTAYSGESAPSLQLMEDGQYLSSPLLRNDIRSISFWIRSTASATTNKLVVTLTDAEGKELTLDTLAVKREVGGTPCAYGEVAGVNLLPLHGRQLRLTFVQETSANLALDDVVIEHGGSFEDHDLALLQTEDCEARLNEAHDGSMVYATVRAFDAEGQSTLWSDAHLVVVNTASGIEEIVAEPTDRVTRGYDLWGRKRGEEWMILRF